jgi:hypothetical protein
MAKLLKATQNQLLMAVLGGVLVWLLADRPRDRYALPIVRWVIIGLLSEIHRRVEAIRFLMDHDFDEKHAPKYDEDGELSLPGR